MGRLWQGVFRPAKLRSESLEAGYWRAYQDFYRWGSILRGAWAKQTSAARLRHVAYAAGWKKFEFLWNFVIRTKRVAAMLPVLDSILEDFGRLPSDRAELRLSGPAHLEMRIQQP